MFYFQSNSCLAEIEVISWDVHDWVSTMSMLSPLGSTDPQTTTIFRCLIVLPLHLNDM